MMNEQMAIPMWENENDMSHKQRRAKKNTHTHNTFHKKQKRVFINVSTVKYCGVFILSPKEKGHSASSGNRKSTQPYKAVFYKLGTLYCVIVQHIVCTSVVAMHWMVNCNQQEIQHQ
jgi:hypothetical protein